MSHVSFISETIYLNDALVWNSFNGLSREHIHQSSEHTNSMIFIFGHIIMSRHFISSEIGLEVPFKYDTLFNYRAEFNRRLEYPSFDELYPLFITIGQLLSSKVIELNDAYLFATSKRKFPTSNDTNLAKLMFLSQHESYHVGQLGILRKQLGFPATSYHPKEH